MWHAFLNLDKKCRLKDIHGSRKVEIEQDISYGQLYKVYLREGEVKISFPRNSRQSYREGYTQYHGTTSSLTYLLHHLY